MKVVWMFIEMI